MYKTTISDEEIFNTNTDEQPKKKKTKRKCSERQLENLRKAREKAKMNRQARKKAKELKNNSNNNNMVIPNNNNNNNKTNNNNNVRFKVRQVQENKPTRTEVNKSIIPTPKPQNRKSCKPQVKQQVKQQVKRANIFSKNNPLNLNYTELIKHQMTLQHRSKYYQQIHQSKRNKIIRQKQIQNYNKNKNIQPIINKRKDVIPTKPKDINPPPIPPKKYSNRKQQDFFNDLF